ncbi:MAG: methionyl-tRNA formyltransferase, partial [Chitinophagia bacterium]|nr:methionyl-tRNA formyltransferase [Chitinophagia bacterium]
TFKLKHEIDTGDILLQRAVPILPTDNAGTLHDKLMVAGAELLVDTLKGIAAGTLPEQPQVIPADGILHAAPKLYKEEMQIDWHRTASAIDRFVKGLAPYPAAFTFIGGKSTKVLDCTFLTTETGQQAGYLDTDHKTYLRMAAADGWVYITQLQQEGKKAMDIEAFLRGFRGQAGH